MWLVQVYWICIICANAFVAYVVSHMDIPTGQNYQISQKRDLKCEPWLCHHKMSLGHNDLNSFIAYLIPHSILKYEHNKSSRYWCLIFDDNIYIMILFTALGMYTIIHQLPQYWYFIVSDKILYLASSTSILWLFGISFRENYPENSLSTTSIFISLVQNQIW